MGRLGHLLFGHGLQLGAQGGDVLLQPGGGLAQPELLLPPLVVQGGPIAADDGPAGPLQLPVFDLAPADLVQLGQDLVPGGLVLVKFAAGGH